ncbi:MAG: LacI family DNA-binding transcriptional regulator [Asticcacaulis sp.]|nr:LacI family DNA-binding transcriptional regulator [Asticcacaulis sp.]
MAIHTKAPPTNGNTVSTINDVARLAGVSIKTVSRVMNDEPNVREETRAKVKEAANLLHYRPNLLAGYHLMAEPQDAHAPDLERSIAGLLATIRLDGVILTPPLCDMAVVLQTVEAAGVPYVRVAPFLYPGRSACVRMDDARAAYEMTDHLLKLGHRDIGFVLGHPEHGASHLRYEGFVKAMRDAGLEPRAEWVKQGYFTFESGGEAAKALFAGASRPTAVFASNDVMAFGMMAQAQQQGLKVPDDVSIVGFDDTPGSTLIWPHLTTIRQPIEDLAHEAADILLARANGEDDGVELNQTNRLLPFELIRRDSARGA